MKTIVTPINLVKYEVITPGVNTAQVNAALRTMMVWLKSNQTEYYRNGLDTLSTKVLDESVRFTGSLNSLGRHLGITPSIPASYQAFNLAEMYRTSVLMKTVGYTQNQALYEVLGQYSTEPTVKEVLQTFKEQYPHLHAPKWSYIQRTITTYYSKGVVQGTPTPDGTLPFWATDTHYSKVSRDSRVVFFTLKLEGLGPVTLKFNLPNKARFTEGKLSRPTVFVDKKGKLGFGFTLQTLVDSPTTTSRYLGIDLGRVTPYVGTILDKNTYSQPIVPNKQVNLLSQKIEKLGNLSQSLWVKEELNKRKGHTKKYEVLRVERLRVRSKISRLKQERVHRVSTNIVNIAHKYNATILLENLSWVPASKWEQSLQQTAIEEKATRRSIKVRKVNPKNTSQTCTERQSKVTHSGRNAKCSSCSKELDRDVLGSRNIARNLTKVSFNGLLQVRVRTKMPGTTRYPEPVTTGIKQPDYAIIPRNTT